MSLSAILEPRISAYEYETDREAAREIQYSLVPAGSLKCDGAEVAYRFSPLAEVGGDFADFFHLPDGQIGIYVGDVVGKGLSAAMYAALVMGTLRGINKTGMDTASVLELLNKRLRVRPVSGRYCATLYALYDCITRQLTFSNAGLPLPLLVSKNGYSRLGDGGLPSAILPGSSYDKHVIRLNPGDAVLFATDGLHELRNHRNEDFGWDRMGELWSACGQKSADESLDHIFEGAKSFSSAPGQHDDITAVALRVPFEAKSCLPDPSGPRHEQEDVEMSAELPVCAAISF